MKRNNALVQEMKLYFGTDEKRIAHALDVMRYAQLLLTTEAGCAGVVIPAAILHDIGIHEAERKYGSSAGPYQEKEGPPIARPIMEKLGIDTKIIDEVCTIMPGSQINHPITLQVVILGCFQCSVSFA